MGRFWKILSALGVVGAVAAGAVFLAPPAKAQIPYGDATSGSCTITNYRRCAYIALDKVHPVRGKAAVQAALTAAQGFSSAGTEHLCEARQFADMAFDGASQLASANPRGRANADAIEQAVSAQLVLGETYRRLAYEAVKPECVIGRDQGSLLGEAITALTPQPSSSRYLTLLSKQAEVYELADGVENKARARSNYATIQTVAAASKKLSDADRMAWADANARLAGLVNERCAPINNYKPTNARPTLEDVRSAVVALANDSAQNRSVDNLCLGDGYLILARSAIDANDRQRNYESASGAFDAAYKEPGLSIAARATAVKKVGLASMGLGATATDPSRARQSYHYAAERFNLAGQLLKSVNGREDGESWLLFAKARVAEVGSGSAYDRTIVNAFNTSIANLGGNVEGLIDANVSAGSYIAGAGRPPSEYENYYRDAARYAANPSATASNSPEAFVKVAEVELVTGHPISTGYPISVRDRVENAATDNSLSATTRANAYYLLAVNSLRPPGDAAGARRYADGAVSTGDGAEKLRSIACLAHIKADLQLTKDWVRGGPVAYCGGASAEAQFLQGLYRLAIVRHIPPNTTEGATEIATAQSAFVAGLQSRAGLDAQPTFSLLAPGITVGDLLKYGIEQAQACNGANITSQVPEPAKGRAKALFGSFNATCN